MIRPAAAAHPWESGSCPGPRAGCPASRRSAWWRSAPGSAGRSDPAPCTAPWSGSPARRCGTSRSSGSHRDRRAGRPPPAGRGRPPPAGRGRPPETGRLPACARAPAGSAPRRRFHSGTPGAAGETPAAPGRTTPHRTAPPPGARNGPARCTGARLRPRRKRRRYTRRWRYHRSTPPCPAHPGRWRRCSCCAPPPACWSR